jgi:integrase
MSAYRRKDLGGWWCYRRVVKLPNGTKIRIKGKAPLNTKASAETAERAHVERVLNPRTESPTVREFHRTLMAYSELNNKDSEVATKRAIFTYRILPLLGDKRLDEIRPEVIEEFKAQLRSGDRPGGVPARKYGDKTVNNTLTVLRTMLGYAVRLERLGSVPRVDKLKVTTDDFDFLDFDELERAVAAATHDTEAMAILLVGAEAGLRIGEVKALKWEDIDFTRRILTVNRRDWRGKLGPPKSGKIRRIPLTSRLQAALKAHRHLIGPWVFCLPDGARYTHNHITSRLARVCRKAGLRIVTYHVLRHTFCSHLAMRGASARAIQELAGHASITTTQRYMHLAPAAGRTAIDLLELRGPSVAPLESTARN